MPLTMYVSHAWASQLTDRQWRPVPPSDSQHYPMLLEDDEQTADDSGHP